MATRRLGNIAAGISDQNQPRDAWSRNQGLRQRNVAGEEDAYARARDTVPVGAGQGIAVMQAAQNMNNARADINGMGAVLQGIKEVGGSKGSRVRMSTASADDPSADSPASWNPAGMTQEAAIADANAFAKGGPLPGWYGGAAPDTQEAFRRRVLQGVKRATS